MYIVAENSEQAGTQARQRAGHEEGGRCAGKGMHGKVIYHAAVFMHVLVCKSSLKVGACQSGLRGACQSLQSQTKPFKKMLPSQSVYLGVHTRNNLCLPSCRKPQSVIILHVRVQLLCRPGVLPVSNESPDLARIGWKGGKIKVIGTERCQHPGG